MFGIAGKTIMTAGLVKPLAGVTVSLNEGSYNDTSPGNDWAYGFSLGEVFAPTQAFGSLITSMPIAGLTINQICWADYSNPVNTERFFIHFDGDISNRPAPFTSVNVNGYGEILEVDASVRGLFRSTGQGYWDSTWWYWQWSTGTERPAGWDGTGTNSITFG